MPDLAYDGHKDVYDALYGLMDAGHERMRAALRAAAAADHTK